MDMPDEGLVLAYSQLERARSLAADGDFAASREAYNRVMAKLSAVAAAMADPELRQSWVVCMRALQEEQELTRAWEEECAELAAWAEKQDLSTPKRGDSATSGASQQASLSRTPSSAAGRSSSGTPAAFGVDTRSFEVAELAPRGRRSAAARGVDGDPDVWLPPEPLPASFPLRRDSRSPCSNSGSKRRGPPGVKPRVDSGAKKGASGSPAGAAGDTKQARMAQLLAKYSEPDQELVRQLAADCLVDVPAVDWGDIAGLDDAKGMLEEHVTLTFLHPEFYSLIPIMKPLKGVLLYGPPGTGKTTLAKAVATAGSKGGQPLHFMTVTPATVASKYRGEGEKLVRMLFELARAHAPCVIFIDEIDALCTHRGSQNEHEASRRLKTELQTQMDGIHSGDRAGGGAPNLLVLAATNRPWDLDEALRRRLEKRVYVPLPSRQVRLQLLELLLRRQRTAPDVNLARIAEATEGYSGDDLTKLMEEAGRCLMRRAMLATHSVHSAHSGGKERLSPAQVKAAIQEAARKLEDSGLEQRDIEGALARSNPSCSADQVGQYLEWAAKYGST